MVISIIGLGLIGSSFALALKKNFPDWTILGYDCNPEHLHFSVHKGIIDKEVSISKAKLKSDIIFLALPVDVIEQLLPQLLNSEKDQFIVDFGSTKAQIENVVINHPRRKHYIAAHPMAGNEFSGPQAADTELFENKHFIICDHEKSEKKYINKFHFILKKLNVRIEYLDVVEHDYIMAFLSHLSHISSFALANAVFSDNPVLESNINLSGGGLLSTIRLANSNANMWIPILMQNKTSVVEAMDLYISNLYKIRQAVLDNNSANLTEIIHTANYAYRKYNSRNLKIITNEN